MTNLRRAGFPTRRAISKHEMEIGGLENPPSEDSQSGIYPPPQSK